MQGPVDFVTMREALATTYPPTNKCHIRGFHGLYLGASINKYDQCLAAFTIVL